VAVVDRMITADVNKVVVDTGVMTGDMEGSADKEEDMETKASNAMGVEATRAVAMEEVVAITTRMMRICKELLITLSNMQVTREIAISSRAYWAT
jgi:hypothetical protein